MDMVELFRSAGAAGYVLLAGSLVASPAGLAGVVLSWVLGRKVAIGSAIVCAAAGLLLLAVGVIGWQHGLYLVSQAISFASPEMRETLGYAGRGEALVSLLIAFAVAGPSLGSAAACAGRVARPPSVQAVLGSLFLAAGVFAACATGAVWLAAACEELRAQAMADPAHRGALVAAMQDAAALRLVVGGAVTLAALAAGGGLLAIAPKEPTAE